jgi:hypothetical protein
VIKKSAFIGLSSYTDALSDVSGHVTNYFIQSNPATKQDNLIIIGSINIANDDYIRVSGAIAKKFKTFYEEICHQRKCDSQLNIYYYSRSRQADHNSCPIFFIRDYIEFHRINFDDMKPYLIPDKIIKDIEKFEKKGDFSFNATANIPPIWLTIINHKEFKFLKLLPERFLKSQQTISDLINDIPDDMAKSRIKVGKRGSLFNYFDTFSVKKTTRNNKTVVKGYYIKLKQYGYINLLMINLLNSLSM